MLVRTTDLVPENLEENAKDLHLEHTYQALGSSYHFSQRRTCVYEATPDGGIVCYP
jgi:hypothetical protein